MTLTEIIERDIAYEERRQRARAGRAADAERTERVAADEGGPAWGAVALWAAVLIAALATAFVAGMSWQIRRDARADREWTDWNERSERAAVESARAKSNHELLKATARVRTLADGQTTRKQQEG